jgi:uncharacterized protein (DUF1697 family)
MTTFIALLRGINVSGKNLILMESLITSLESIGLLNVRTYIQSGNILFNYTESPNSMLEKSIRDTILKDFNCNVPVIVMTSKEMEKFILENPFVNERNMAIDSLHITCLSGSPDKELMNRILPLNDGIDEALILGTRIYLHCPTGYGRTRYTNTFFEKKLKQNATTRNWKTMLKLSSMIVEHYT